MIKFAVLREGIIPPKKATPHSAAFDMFLPQDITVKPGERVTIPSGISHECPPGVVGVLSPRSGLALKKGWRCFFSPALIDSDYRGEIGVLMENQGEETLSLLAGDRFAQIVYLATYAMDAEIVPVSDLSSTYRGEGGWGSTGGAKL